MSVGRENGDGRERVVYDDGILRGIILMVGF